MIKMESQSVSEAETQAKFFPIESPPRLLINVTCHCPKALRKEIEAQRASDAASSDPATAEQFYNFKTARCQICNRIWCVCS